MCVRACYMLRYSDSKCHVESFKFGLLKVKAVPLHATKALGGRGYIPIVQEAGWAPEPVWTQR
jgi:hypothetical protein